MFSNHITALPLEKEDRRIFAIRNPSQRRSTDYYDSIYAAAGDPLFIASVRKIYGLGTYRDSTHSSLRPYRIEEVIEASKSESEKKVETLVRDYPSDCIASAILQSLVWGGPLPPDKTAGLKHIALRVGIKKHPHECFIAGRYHSVWILRNSATWLVADRDATKAEVLRAEELWNKEHWVKITPNTK